MRHAAYLFQRRGPVQGYHVPPGRDSGLLDSYTAEPSTTHFCLVGHYEGKLSIHRSAPDEVSVLHRVTQDQVPLPAAYQTTKEYPHRFEGSSVRAVPIILQDVENVLVVAHIDFPVQRQEG